MFVISLEIRFRLLISYFHLRKPSASSRSPPPAAAAVIALFPSSPLLFFFKMIYLFINFYIAASVSLMVGSSCSNFRFRSKQVKNWMSRWQLCVSMDFCGGIREVTGDLILFACLPVYDAVPSLLSFIIIAIMYWLQVLTTLYSWICLLLSY